MGSFRQRLLELAEEHEELLKSVDSLKVECDELRLRLVVASREATRCEELAADNRELKAKLAELTSNAGDAPDLLAPDPEDSPLRLRNSPDRGGSEKPRRDKSAAKRKVDSSVSIGRKADDSVSPVRGRAAALALVKRKDDNESEDGSSSYSSSSSPPTPRVKPEGVRGRLRAKRKERAEKTTRRGHEKGVRRRRRRREKSGRSERPGRGGHARSRGGRSGRSRSRKASRSRSRRMRLSSAGSGGAFGTGDHRMDLDSFISKNQLEARVAHALRTMSQEDQKKVMGTDGGENSFLLIDRVKSPNAVVMSRIRKLEAR